MRPEDISILVVVGAEDISEFEAQVRGSRFAWDIRLLGVKSLFRLLKLKEALDVLPSKFSEPFASVLREPPWWLSIRSSFSRRRSKTVLFSVLFPENTLDLQAIVLFAF